MSERELAEHTEVLRELESLKPDRKVYVKQGDLFFLSSSKQRPQLIKKTQRKIEVCKKKQKNTNN